MARILSHHLRLPSLLRLGLYFYLPKSFFFPTAPRAALLLRSPSRHARRLPPPSPFTSLWPIRESQSGEEKTAQPEVWLLLAHILISQKLEDQQTPPPTRTKVRGGREWGKDRSPHFALVRGQPVSCSACHVSSQQPPPLPFARLRLSLNTVRGGGEDRELCSPGRAVAVPSVKVSRGGCGQRGAKSSEEPGAPRRRRGQGLAAAARPRPSGPPLHAPRLRAAERARGSRSGESAPHVSLCGPGGGNDTEERRPVAPGLAVLVPGPGGEPACGWRRRQMRGTESASGATGTRKAAGISHRRCPGMLRPWRRKKARSQREGSAGETLTPAGFRNCPAKEGGQTCRQPGGSLDTWIYRKPGNFITIIIIVIFAPGLWISLPSHIILSTLQVPTYKYRRRWLICTYLKCGDPVCSWHKMFLVCLFFFPFEAGRLFSKVAGSPLACVACFNSLGRLGPLVSLCGQICHLTVARVWA